ncbi:carboxymethylenebutenolidase [Tanacetum coccineum]|uniref:Carboxymethylenebutenolidase n=1 Tax=Tanacetum coccineum TaxID=301880 RepID=A0ABQ5JDF4_9ASTR
MTPNRFVIDGFGSHVGGIDPYLLLSAETTRTPNPGRSTEFVGRTIEWRVDYPFSHTLPQNSRSYLLLAEPIQWLVYDILLTGICLCVSWSSVRCAWREWVDISTRMEGEGIVVSSSCLREPERRRMNGIVGVRRDGNHKKKISLRTLQKHTGHGMRRVGLFDGDWVYSGISGLGDLAGCPLGAVVIVSGLGITNLSTTRVDFLYNSRCWRGCWNKWHEFIGVKVRKWNCFLLTLLTHSRYWMGGALGIASSVFVPEIDAAVAFYGVPPTELADAAKIKQPAQAQFG